MGKELEEKDAQEIIEKLLEQDILAKVDRLIVFSRMELNAEEESGGSFKLEINTKAYYLKPGKARIEQTTTDEFGNTSRRIILTVGDRTWINADGGTRALDSGNFYGFPAVGFSKEVEDVLKETGAVCELAGEDLVEAETVTIIEERGTGTRFFIDCERFVPIKMESLTLAGRFEIYNKDFREVESAGWFPYLVEVFHDGVLISSTTIEKILTEGDFPEELFDPEKL